jgi:flavin-dependent dehydrogenase
MEACDVVIAGGGPAGSTCAWALRRSGADVVVLDRAVFPRDKVCAGWITPQVLTELEIDTEDYRRGRTLQPIAGFRTGVIGRRREVETSYGRVVSYGIRRCEFDHYLLMRSGARLRLGVQLSSLRREGSTWVVNESLKAPVLVGAGGHFCPVARWLNPDRERRRPGAGKLVVAQEAEFQLTPAEARSLSASPDTPMLYFCKDLKGYGWCFRKEGFVNVGFGRLESGGLPKAQAEFVRFLQTRWTIPRCESERWRGHAYLLHPSPRRHIVGDGVLIVGDAAGLAYPQSGEGIRPAVESGLIAARTIAKAAGSHGHDELVAYEAQLRDHFGAAGAVSAAARFIESTVPRSVAVSLMQVPAFVRHVVLDRWFLHAADAPVALS